MTKWLRATALEFRHRWWVIWFICGVAMANWLGKRQGHTSDSAYRLVFAFGALL